MFTIKAYDHEGRTRIYEAIEIIINPNKTVVEFIRPGSELVECLLLTDVVDNNFNSVYIENQSGKTIESCRPHERVTK